MDIAYNKTDGVVLPITNTRISASEYNQIAASLMQIITSAGLTPDAANNVQLLNALKAMGSSWSMPSNTYNDLTLGASGSTYTAPANGWVKCTLNVSANGWLDINQQWVQASNVDGYITILKPLLKGQTFYVGYDKYLSTIEFRFYYAEGAN